MIQRPLLIAVEGCDGTGKTTIVAAIVRAFLSLGIAATSIKRPAKDALAAFYAQGQAVSDSQVLAMMNADCRAAIDTARAMQANGTPIVILDRHYISAAIYQGGDDWEAEFERQREMWGEPDVWIHCTSYGSDAVARINARENDPQKHIDEDVVIDRMCKYQHIFDEMIKVRPFEVWLDGPATGFTMLVSLGFTSANNLTADECAAWIVERLKTK